MEIFGVDDLYRASRTREVHLTNTSKSLFKIHCPMTVDGLRSRLMCRQPPPLQVDYPIDKIVRQNKLLIIFTGTHETHQICHKHYSEQITFTFVETKQFINNFELSYNL